MVNNFSNINEMTELIKDELNSCEFGNFDCKDCSEVEVCFYKASAKANHEFAKNLDYNGYNTEEEFWENL